MWLELGREIVGLVMGIVMCKFEPRYRYEIGELTNVNVRAWASSSGDGFSPIVRYIAVAIKRLRLFLSSTQNLLKL